MSTATPTGSTYGDLQNEERFKKLERTLKYLLIQGKQQKSTNLNNWPSVSSINGDALDTSVAGFSAHSSRIGSEVIASSRDMRKVIHGRPQRVDTPKMATSSVKQFPAGTPEEERVLMPPPSSVGILAHSSRRNSLFGAAKSTPPGSAGPDHGFAQSVISSIKCSSVAKDTSKVEFERESTENSKSTPDTPSRIFSKWRPVLNDKGQLIIKGTLECGKVARSKPVIRRLSATSVQSIFKHIYHLDGNICDERGELPEYIRGKFFGGFPDDWENVYQVWSNYVAGGCSDGFRWPTPITDSDDDLKSEITDVTVQRPRRLRARNASPEGIVLSPPRHTHPTRPEDHIASLPEKKSSPRKRPHPSRERNQPVSDQIPQETIKERQATADQYNEERSVLCIGCNSSRGVPAEEGNETIENFIERVKRQQLNTSLCSSSSLRPTVTSLKDIIHEDKLQIILENLTSKNCPIEYIDKIIEMFDCLKYVVTYKSEDPGSEPRAPSRTPACVHNASQSDTPYLTSAFRQSPEKPTKPIEVINNKTYVTRRQPVRRKLSSRDYDSSDSCEHSEERTVPAQPLRTRERALRHRKKQTRWHRRKVNVSDSDQDLPPRHKSPRYDLHPIANNPKRDIRVRSKPVQRLVSYDSSVSFSEDERRAATPRGTYDSSVSITEDEFGHSQRRNETKKILQEANAKILKSFEALRRETGKTQEASQPDKGKPSKSAETSLLDDNKENEKSPNVPKESAQQTSPKNSCAEQRKRKPTVVNIEKVATSIPPVTKANLSPKNTSVELTKSISTATCSSTSKEHEVKEKQHNPGKEKDTKKTSKSDEKPMRKAKFGTELNPKLLTSWVPKLSRKSDGTYGLVFEGKLLNEASHVESRRFSTAVIERRVSPQVVETESHEFYELVGDLCDTKHTVPKEVQKLCFKGCPARITRFCEKWSRLIEEEAKRQSLNTTTVDMMSVPTSSRGRRILPPLSYWTGERVALKDNTPVYTPGTSQESTISSLEASFSRDVSQNSSRKRDTSTMDTSINSGLNSSSKKEKKELDQKEERSTRSRKTPPEPETAKKPLRSKRRPARDICEDSSDHEEPKVVLKSKKRRQKTDTVSPTKRIKSKEDERAKLQTRSSKTRSGVTCTLHKNVPYRDDILSDDQPSLV